MRRLRQRCERGLEDFPLPVPFSIPALVENIERARNRKIELVEIIEPDADLRTACGLRARFDDVTFIFYRGRPTPNQTQHTVLHELAHEWFNHGTTLSCKELEQHLPQAVRDRIAERMGSEAVFQARTRYETPEEREAELAASLIKRIARSQPVGDDMLSLLEASLSHPVAVRRRTQN
ncbi:hypothetical protein [Streptomyces sp. NBC_01304]|uniref:hypothetical protein n=1 Tax=Streptomyces sp. NBC_01304 TaxID=2903818 RepID=UPI002E10E289|nr:hypothetical protein OG430_48080 [Streptomyces sp. NBC_01304]